MNRITVKKEDNNNGIDSDKTNVETRARTARKERHEIKKNISVATRARFGKSVFVVRAGSHKT